tara:strand:+ start:166 stop:384 length:219 start_codon:yes stop_codon:yes gene_type:complete
MEEKMNMNVGRKYKYKGHTIEKYRKPNRTTEYVAIDSDGEVYYLNSGYNNLDFVKTLITNRLEDLGRKNGIT